MCDLAICAFATLAVGQFEGAVVCEINYRFSGATYNTVSTEVKDNVIHGLPRTIQCNIVFQIVVPRTRNVLDFADTCPCHISVASLVAAFLAADAMHM